MRKNAFRNLIAVIFLVTATSCNKEAGEGVAYLEVAQNYPEKEVLLSDIADISYHQMKSDRDEYLFRGSPVAFGKNTVVIVDRSRSERILFFSKDGEPQSYISRKGQGPEEYAGVNQVVYDEENGEVFVVYRNVIQVYSFTGEHRRKISLPQGTFVSPIVSFDEHSLFLYDASIQARKTDEETPGRTQTDAGDYLASSFVRISKADGKPLDCIKLPTTETELGLYREMEGASMLVRGLTHRLIKGAEGVMLCNPETDTVFLYTKDGSLRPVITKIPPVSKQTPMVYLNNCVDAGRFQFMEVYTLRFEEGARPYPVTYLMRDKKSGDVFRQKIILPDYPSKIFYISPRQTGSNYEFGAYFELDLIELKQAYVENKLEGKLKEIVAASNENEDNNIFVHFLFK